MPQKLPARSSRLRGRRRDEDDGGDDVRTFSSTFSRLPFLCDVGKKLKFNHFINLFVKSILLKLNHLYNF
jgi:hypothetical protein